MARSPGAQNSRQQYPLRVARSRPRRGPGKGIPSAIPSVIARDSVRDPVCKGRGGLSPIGPGPGTGPGLRP
jgi:hypothetical protein